MAFLPFEDLKVFQLAEQLADEIWDIVIIWKYFEKITLGQQWVDAADSVGANIAEGAGRGTPKENKRFIRIARGSFNETKYWLRRAKRRKLVDTDQTAKLQLLIDQIGPSLNAYMKSIGKNA
ncbi:MAG: four helix bundle protein [Deltaproteobacteria bacterium]|jgi:four helix bundle protein|nr:four helix bundle protein [Deltaproteobacteria bacterium]